MKLATLAMVGSLAALLAAPAVAQTPQTTPGKPAPSLSTNPGSPTTSPATKAMPAPAARTSPASTLVDINSASASELEALHGIGKTRADAIIKNRPYTGKDDLLSRHIVPQNVYDGIKDKIIARKG
ncbi:MAG TPA: DNA-binding protein [Acetobacteraceae bacterium]|jgi:competence protein ComEA|nr:DNA-binding protein [Acetobacteraceae bacterium]